MLLAGAAPAQQQATRSLGDAARLEALATSTQPGAAAGARQHCVAQQGACGDAGDGWGAYRGPHTLPTGGLQLPAVVPCSAELHSCLVQIHVGIFTDSGSIKLPPSCHGR
jgi:hypothetical protein